MNSLDYHNKTNNKPLSCQLCFDTILSKKHADCCYMINMYEIRKYKLDKNFKPMMTYGLCGCIAIIMINKNNYQIIFAHHPDYQMIKLFLILTIIKLMIL